MSLDIKSKIDKLTYKIDIKGLEQVFIEKIKSDFGIDISNIEKGTKMTINNDFIFNIDHIKYGVDIGLGSNGANFWCEIWEINRDHRSAGIYCNYTQVFRLSTGDKVRQMTLDKV